MMNRQIASFLEMTEVIISLLRFKVLVVKL